MSNLKNSVRLMGNLGAAPEVKVVANDKKVARFSLATNEVHKNDKGERVQATYWHQVVAWGNLASIAEKFLKKGSEVMLEGKLTNRSYTDKEGNKRFITEIIANELLMTGGKSEGE